MQHRAGVTAASSSTEEIARMKTTAKSNPRSPVAVAPSTEPAVIEEVSPRLRVRRSGDGASRAVIDARLARIPGYLPTVGDRVIVSFGESESYVIAVLHASAPETLLLPDGARAELSDGRLELRDAAGRLLVRYEEGRAEIAAPAGDLHLSAPMGRVVIESGLDAIVRAGRDTRIESARRFEIAAGGKAPAAPGEPAPKPLLEIDARHATLRAPRVEVNATSARLATSRATVLSRTIAVTAEQLSQTVVKYELTAERLIEKTRDTFRDASDLAQTRAGRLRTIVKDVLSMHARRSVLVSTDETSIDGKKVLLG
ncbi:MAG: DUF3540 domain-containing protein [Minicystis sp.]